MDGLGGIDGLEVEISRTDMAGALRKLQLASNNCIHKALIAANIAEEGIDEVVLVGGSTRLAFVHAYLQAKFPTALVGKVGNEDEAVAQGAAIQAAIIDGQKHTSLDGFFILDRLALAIGVRSARMKVRPDGKATEEVEDDDVMVPAVERNASIPTHRILNGVKPLYKTQRAMTFEVCS